VPHTRAIYGRMTQHAYGKTIITPSDVGIDANGSMVAN
jgi:hypothetical protein